MLKAVIFDLFETLITEASNVKITSSKIAEILGIQVNEYKAFTSKIRYERYRGKWADFRDVLVDVMQSLGKPYNEELINKIAVDREKCKAKCFENISKDILTMLAELKKWKLKLGIISNASCEEIPGYEGCALKPFFDEVIFSCNTGYVKPEPEIYYETCKRLNTDPKDCLYIGDGGSNELIGAKDVGMKVLCSTWYISKLGHATPEGLPVVKSTNELISKVTLYMSGKEGVEVYDKN